MTEAGELLVLQDLRITIGGRAVVDGLDLTVRSGRITALVGESGSGKSISALTVIGLQPETAEVSGSIRLQGEELVGRSAQGMRRVRGRRVGMIFQEPGQSLSPVMRISGVFRDALAVREGIRSRAGAERRAQELLASVGLADPPRITASFPHELSGGELQRVLIALALSGDPALLIADEPTTALDVTVQRGILDLLREIVEERGIGILLITHDMGVVGEIADDVSVLQDGHQLERGDVADVLSAPADPYTRELLSAVPRLADGLSRTPRVVRGAVVDAGTAGGGPKLGVDPAVGIDAAAGIDAATTDAPPPPVVRIEGLTVDYARRGRVHRALDGVSVEIPRGGIHGLVGESGSGKSTWGKALAGLVPVQADVFELDGADPRTLPAAQRRALHARIGLIFQDPASSLNPRRTVGWSIGEPLLLAGASSRREIEARTREALELVRLPPSYATRLPHELSGGQRQRVSVARALIRRPSLLIADEPTSALDVTTQAHLIEVLRDAVEVTELSCVFISHDLAVVGQLVDRVTVLRGGKVVEQGAVADVLGSPQHEYARRLVASIPDPLRRVGAGATG